MKRVVVAAFRSMLYAPGSEPRKMRKALNAGADAVIFDLEDAVAPEKKADARAEVARVLDEVSTEEHRHPPIFVRVNSQTSGLQEDDLAAVVRPGIAGLKLPKTETAEELVVLDHWCTEQESGRGLIPGSVGVIPGIESAAGLQALDPIARAPRVICLSFGAVDFARDIGTAPSADGTEALVALSLIAIASAAAGIQRPMDSAWSNLGDEDGLRRTASLARRLGFQGKAVIHPTQVAIVNQIFDVSDAEVSWATAVLAESEAAERGGRGALQVAGSLVDAAHVRRARAILELRDSREARNAGT